MSGEINCVIFSSYRNEFVMDMCEWRDQVCYIFKTEVYLNLRIFSE